MKKKILKICAISLGVIALLAASIVLVKYLKEKQWEKEMSRSEAIAAKALDLLCSGDTATARLVALSALPKNIEKHSSPYALEAEKVLRMASVKDEIVLNGHTEKVNYATFSPDKYSALSVSDDKSVVVWKLLDDKRFQLDVLMKYDGHSERVNHATFSHEGTQIASASDDHIVRVWEHLPLQDLIDLTKKEMGGRELTPEELKKYGIND